MFQRPATARREPPWDALDMGWLQSLSEPVPECGCWLWLLAPSRTGYGKICRGKKHLSAHRAAWMVANDSAIPPGLCVLHKCDTPLCVNPDHLFLGTHAENMRDMGDKGRAHLPPQIPKLSPAQAAEVRASSGTQKQIARRFGLSAGLVSNIKNGKSPYHFPTQLCRPAKAGESDERPCSA